MKRWVQGCCIALGSVAATVLVLAAALAWGPHHCKAVFPMVIGCAIGSYESLAGGMVAAGAALFAGWLAWSAVQVQVDAEATRAAADNRDNDGNSHFLLFSPGAECPLALVIAGGSWLRGPGKTGHPATKGQSRPAAWFRKN